MDERLKRIKELFLESEKRNGELAHENFELKKRIAELEDTLAKVLNSADKFAESLFECRKAEMVNVVRCKDCKYCKIEDWDKNNCRVCTRDRYIRSDSWFCSGGERKDNNG